MDWQLKKRDLKRKNKMIESVTKKHGIKSGFGEKFDRLISKDKKRHWIYKFISWMVSFSWWSFDELWEHPDNPLGYK